MRITLAMWAAVLAAGSGCLGQVPPAVRTTSKVRVWVDQIGYRPDARKLLVVASDQALPAKPVLELVSAETNKVVWKLADHPAAYRIFGGNSKDRESGDYCAQLDLSDFKTPGRYYVRIGGELPPERSYMFRIGEYVYRDSGLAAWKSFYFQRGDGAKPEKYAGPWNHAEAFTGPGQAADAKVYHWEKNAHWDPVVGPVIDPKGHDVRGSWWDAGNFDKYIGNTCLCNIYLLPALDMIAGAAKDKELNIPESGNGIPDLFDEVRYSIEWFIRMADANGAAYGRMYIPTDCPPSKSRKPCQLTETTSGGTMNRLAMLALASVTWSNRRIEPAFARKCMDESLKAWKLLEARPHPWPADPKDPKKLKYTGEWYFTNYDWSRALAAACYFRQTGEKKWHDVVKAAFQKGLDGANPDAQPAMWVYCRSKGAEPELVRKIKDALASAAGRIVKSAGPNRAYGAGLHGYWWGSNRAIGQAGYTCILAAELTDDPARKKTYLDAAEEFIHYLHGRNPVGLCYMTNYKRLGAENSATVMFHAWLGNPNHRKQGSFGWKYIGEGPGKIGPPPGYVVGGPNGGMKKYRNDLEYGCWEFNENCLSYQGPVAALISYFGYRIR